MQRSILQTNKEAIKRNKMNMNSATISTITKVHFSFTRKTQNTCRLDCRNCTFSYVLS